MCTVGLVISVLITAANTFAEEINSGEDAVDAYAKAWKANRELLPALQAELKVVNRNHDLKVSETKQVELSNGGIAEFRRDPESTNLYRVSRDQNRMRVTAITPAEDIDLLQDLLVIGPDWKTMERGVLVLRRRDQIGGRVTVDPYDLQSPELQFDSPDELARAIQPAPWLKSVSYESTEKQRGQLKIRTEFERDFMDRIIDFDLTDGMWPVRYRQYHLGKISSDPALEYESLGERGGRICTRRTWRMRPDGQNEVSGEPRAWYTELCYEIRNLRVLDQDDLGEVFSQTAFQADRVIDHRNSPIDD